MHAYVNKQKTSHQHHIPHNKKQEKTKSCLGQPCISKNGNTDIFSATVYMTST